MRHDRCHVWIQLAGAASVSPEGLLSIQRGGLNAWQVDADCPMVVGAVVIVATPGDDLVLPAKLPFRLAVVHRASLKTVWRVDGDLTFDRRAPIVTVLPVQIAASLSGRYRIALEGQQLVGAWFDMDVTLAADKPPHREGDGTDGADYPAGRED